jgi:mannose-6-phosphate isomerase-like protein (cupin superfamily)
MSAESRAAHISDLEIGTPEGRRWAQVRATFGIGAFGVNAWTADSPDRLVISEHDESRGPRPSLHEELYFVVNGHAVFTINEDEVDAPAGTFVFVRDPAAKRKAVAKEAGTTVLAAGGPRGKAFEPVEWERGAHALRHWETKDWEAAVAELSELHGEHPEDAGILYNLACAESLAGRREDALGHLRLSVQLDASFAELVADDSDFDPIRDDPELSAIAGQTNTPSPSS